MIKGVTYWNVDLNCERDDEKMFAETPLCIKYGFEFIKDYDHHTFELEDISDDTIYEFVGDLKEYLRNVRVHKSKKTNFEIEIIGTGELMEDESFIIYNINEEIQNKIEQILDPVRK